MIVTCPNQVFEPKLSMVVEAKLDHFQRGDATTPPWPGDVPPERSQQLQARYRRQNRRSPFCADIFGLIRGLPRVAYQHVSSWHSRVSARSQSNRLKCEIPALLRFVKTKLRVPQECTPVRRVPSSGFTRQLLWNVVKNSLEWSAESAGLTVCIQRQPAAWHQMLLKLFMATRQDQPRPRDPASRVTKGSN